MNELIKVDCSGEQMKVSGRELHEFLGVDTPYHKWFPRMCEYGFAENVDFEVTDIFVHNPKGGAQSKKDAKMSMDMAKEICMVTRNEKGKVARQYFLQVEKDWNSPDKVMARALKIADQTISQLNQTIAVMIPKATFADQVSDCTNCIYIGDLAKLLSQNGFAIGRDKLFELMRNEGFLLKAPGQWNKPSQYAMNLGLFKVIEKVVDKGGVKEVKSTTMVTPKGIKYFLNRYLVDKLAGQAIEAPKQLSMLEDE